MGSRSPLELLRGYERRANALRAKERQHAVEHEGGWRAIAFRLGEHHFLCDLALVSEVIKTPACAPVPRAKTWFLGLANVRGTLLPVTDLHRFLFAGLLQQRDAGRVLVVGREEETAVGLRVDEVFGLRTLQQAPAASAERHGEPVKSRFEQQRYSAGGKEWTAIDLQQLVVSDEFLNIGR